MEEKRPDYTTYPEGFLLLVEELDVPGMNEEPEKKKSFLIGFVDSLIKQ